MVVDLNWAEDKALIKLPYEFAPLPSKGQMVIALDRAGSHIGEAEVISVVQPKSKTPIISIAVDKGMIKTIRNIKLSDDTTQDNFDAAYHPQDSSIICRCSDITREELHQYIAQGHASIDEIKRVTRLGMGPCQGRTCVPLVMRELSQILNKPMAELAPATHRPVVTSIKLGQLAQYNNVTSKEHP